MRHIKVELVIEHHHHHTETTDMISEYIERYVGRIGPVSGLHVYEVTHMPSDTEQARERRRR